MCIQHKSLLYLGPLQGDISLANAACSLSVCRSLYISHSPTSKWGVKARLAKILVIVTLLTIALICIHATRRTHIVLEVAV